MLFVNWRADHDQVETAWVSFGDVLYYHVDVSYVRCPFSYPLPLQLSAALRFS
jgi:hypothetical protein